MFSSVKRFFHFIRGSPASLSFLEVFSRFQKILALNNRILELMADMGDKLGGDYIFDKQYIISTCEKMSDYVSKLIYNLDAIASHKYSRLFDVFNKINEDINQELKGKIIIPESDFIISYESINRDFSDIVGSKNANLAEIKNFLDIRTPEGFAITSHAFKFYMDYNDIWQKISKIYSAWKDGKITTIDASTYIQSIIKAGVIPPEIKKEIKNAIKMLQSSDIKNNLYLAIRSSAWGEDSEYSFAGQFMSILNHPANNIFEAYKEVLASAYSSMAMEYRKNKNYSEYEIVMAVACQKMIDAYVSGVLYTLDPVNPENENMIITSTWGLGAPVVSGHIRGDQFIVSRDSQHEIKGFSVVRKSEKMIPRSEGGTQIVAVEEELQTKASITREQIKELASLGMIIERYFKRPQDIEFCIDKSGRIFILQTRPFNIGNKFSKFICNLPSTVKNYPVIFSGKGDIAQKGIGAGKVYLVQTEEDLENFPEGAILVARTTSPRFAKVIRKANAVITDIGSPTGHMATIAREFRVPTIVNTGIATKVLINGQEITVDAEENIIYEGKIKELRYYEFTEEPFEETPEYRLLRRILKKISPLNLLDPMDKSFSIKNCKTFHDITRFIHEKAVEEIVYLSYYEDKKARYEPLKLDIPIPLEMILIDIGEGINENIEDIKVTPQDIQSIPMKALIEGLVSSGAWSTEPLSVDFKSFMSSLTRTFASSIATPRYIGQNLAILSKNYVNINLRLGYHFNMIDSYMSDNINDNYIYFRFMGGVTDITRRSRRAKLIGEILTSNDFRVDLRGDLVIARIKKLSIDDMKIRLRLIGLLIAFTRQLDLKMISDSKINHFMDIFKTMTNDII